MRAVADELYLATDDGSYGFHGNGCQQLQALVDSGKKYDHCVAIGPMIMMKFVCLLTKELVVGDEVKFACVDGPEFDGHLVDFDQAMARAKQYKTEEGRALLKQQEGDTHHGGCGNCGGDK